MGWVKLDDQFFRNAKAVQAGRDGKLLYLAGLAFCSGALTDGVIPPEALPIVAADAHVKPAVAERLVDVGLWVRHSGGYLIPDYLDYNPSAESERERRERDRQRKAKGRGAQGRGPDGRKTSGGSPNGRPPGIPPDGGPESEPNADGSPPVPSPSPPEGNSSSSGTGRCASGSDDDVGELALRILAQRRFDEADAKEPIDGNPTKWLHTALERVRSRHGTRVAGLLARKPDLTAPDLADLLEPKPQAKPDEGPLRPGDRARNDCETCDGSGWVDAADHVTPCPTCAVVRV